MYLIADRDLWQELLQNHRGTIDGFTITLRTRESNSDPLGERSHRPRQPPDSVHIYMRCVRSICSARAFRMGRVAWSVGEKARSTSRRGLRSAHTRPGALGDTMPHGVPASTCDFGPYRRLAGSVSLEVCDLGSPIGPIWRSARRSCWLVVPPG
jgi:hypothetical protein